MQTVMKWTWNTVFRLTGLDLSFDIRYRRLSLHQLELRAHVDAVARALAERGLSPVETSPGVVPLFVGCLDMLDVAWFPPYREVSIHVPVQPVGDDEGELLCHLYLPVTTEAALWAGRDVSGMPKLLAEIERSEEDGRLLGRLSVDGERVLETEARDAEGQDTTQLMRFYGQRAGRIIRTDYESTGAFHHSSSGEGASLRLGTHPMADHLRELLVSTEVHAALVGRDVSAVLRRPVVVR